ETQCAANNGTFAKRGVPHPCFPKPVCQTFCYFKSPSIFSNILPHQNQRIVCFHTLGKPFFNSIYESYGRSLFFPNRSSTLDAGVRFRLFSQSGAAIWQCRGVNIS